METLLFPPSSDPPLPFFCWNFLALAPCLQPHAGRQGYPSRGWCKWCLNLLCSAIIFPFLIPHPLLEVNAATASQHWWVRGETAAAPTQGFRRDKATTTAIPTSFLEVYLCSGDFPPAPRTSPGRHSGFLAVRTGSGRYLRSPPQPLSGRSTCRRPRRGMGSAARCSLGGRDAAGSSSARPAT